LGWIGLIPQPELEHLIDRLAVQHPVGLSLFVDGTQRTPDFLVYI
jgi:hypothetical protein